MLAVTCVCSLRSCVLRRDYWCSLGYFYKNTLGSKGGSAAQNTGALFAATLTNMTDYVIPLPPCSVFDDGSERALKYARPAPPRNVDYQGGFVSGKAVTFNTQSFHYFFMHPCESPVPDSTSYTQRFMKLTVVPRTGANFQILIGA